MLFIPLLKVDSAQRLVYGRIDETPDRAGEVFDYVSSKPHFEKWSAEMHKASDGKSVGNLRAMHGRVAAGTFQAIDFDDAGKSIDLIAHVVDDDEWKKVEAGVYTGFSPGGRYAHRWKDGAYTRYTALPSEISLVDLPCIPSATFTMVKVDGDEEWVPFVSISGDDLTKAGRRHSAADMTLIQTVHDHAALLGATCAGHASGDPMGKIDATGELVKAQLASVSDERDRLRKRVAELEAQPMPGGPRLRSIGKAEDIGGLDELSPTGAESIAAMPNGEAKSLAIIKQIQRGRY